MSEHDLAAHIDEEVGDFLRGYKHAKEDPQDPDWWCGRTESALGYMIGRGDLLRNDWNIKRAEEQARRRLLGVHRRF